MTNPSNPNAHPRALRRTIRVPAIAGAITISAGGLLYQLNAFGSPPPKRVLGEMAAPTPAWTTTAPSTQPVEPPPPPPGGIKPAPAQWTPQAPPVPEDLPANPAGGLRPAPVNWTPTAPAQPAPAMLREDVAPTPTKWQPATRPAQPAPVPPAE